MLHALRAMGHGDSIAIVDANYPAESALPKCLRLDGIKATDALKAVLSLLPLDSYIDHPAIAMQVVGNAVLVPRIVASFQKIINDMADKPVKISSLDRFEFYGLAAKSFAIIQTGETRLYGNIILTKGVVSE